MVQLDATQEVAGPEGERWRLVYEPSSGAPVEMRLAWGSERPSTNPSFSVAAAQLTRVSSGSGEAFIQAVATAFGGARPNDAPPAVKELRFDLAILGRKLEFAPPNPQAQVIAGSFTDNPSGNWIATKLFLAGGDGEVFLALDARDHKAVFLPKDPDYADVIVRELVGLLR